jgi:hypothetical protein
MTTTTGDLYDDARTPNETTRLIRADIKAAIKDGTLAPGKYSVRRAAGAYRGIYATVVVPDIATAYRPVDPSSQADAQAAYRGQETVVREEIVAAGAKIRDIANRYLRSTSDVQTDYFHGGYVLVFLSSAANGGGTVIA